MAIALVSNTIAGTAANGGTTGAINTTGASLLIVGLSWSSNSGTTPPPVTDSKSNTWTRLTAQEPTPPNTDSYSVIYYAKNPTVGSGHTFTASLTNSFPTIGVQAFSGVDTSSPFDVENGTAINHAFTADITSVQPGSVTPSNDGSLIVTVLSNYIDSSNSDRSINQSFTISDQLGFVTTIAMGMAYQIQTTATARNPTWSWTNAVFLVSTAIAVFKAASAAPSSGHRGLPLLGVG